jgi:hypothetical protein
LAVLLGALVVGAAFVSPNASPPALEHTYESPRALAEEVLGRFRDADRSGLAELALSESEFKERVWPQMPAAGNVPVDYVWSDLSAKSHRGLSRSLARHGGRQFELLDIRFTKGTTAYQTFVVHRSAQLLVRDQQGREGALDVMGSVIEEAGRYKLFSFVVDR